MKKLDGIINTIKENKYLHYLIIIIIGIIISIPLKNIQIRDTHDGFLHLLRLIGVTDTLKIGQIPSIIIPDFCSQAGYSMTLFYQPLVTYIPLLFKIITPTYAICLKLFGLVCIVLSGITMYNFIYKVTKNRKIALFAALIYMTAPYKLGNVYKRYAIGEFVALIFMPTLFTGMHNLFNGDGKKHYYISLGASLLILSHTITTLYATAFCALYIIFNLEKLKDKKIIKKIIINVLFILAITMLFYMPMLEAKMNAQYAIFDNDIMRTTNWFAQKNAIELSQFFTDIGEENGTTYIIGIPIVLLLLSTIYAYRKVDKENKKIYIIFLIFSIISLYMSSKYFPWGILPDFACKLQYPWRMMGFFDFFISLVCGINLYILLKSFIKKDIIKITLVFVLLILLMVYTLAIVNQYKTTNDKGDINYENWVLKNPAISHMNVNRDYLPVKAILKQNTYMKTRENNTVVLEGKATIIDEQKEKLTSKMKIKDASCNTILEFSYIYYPGYTVTIKQNDITTLIKTEESENGYVSIKLPDDIENAELEINFEPTIITKFSYMGSTIFTIIFILYIVIENRRNRC